MSKSHNLVCFPLHRRDVLKGGASLAAAGLPGGWLKPRPPLLLTRS